MRRNTQLNRDFRCANYINREQRQLNICEIDKTVGQVCPSYRDRDCRALDTARRVDGAESRGWYNHRERYGAAGAAGGGNRDIRFCAGINCERKRSSNLRGTNDVYGAYQYAWILTIYLRARHKIVSGQCNRDCRTEESARRANGGQRGGRWSDVEGRCLKTDTARGCHRYGSDS